MEKKVEDEFKKIEKRLSKLEYANETLNKINKVIRDFWNEDNDCDDVDALGRILKIMEKYNDKM